eukprot:Sspe_Gene.18053::Locus_6462_Transcript_1_2_Confidence_0.667_Length_3307::g.18053::m.18053
MDGPRFTLPTLVDTRQTVTPHQPSRSPPRTRPRRKEPKDDREVGLDTQILRVVSEAVHDPHASRPHAFKLTNLREMRSGLATAAPSTAQQLQVQTWLDSYVQEQGSFKSTTTCAEILLARVLRATEDLPEPNWMRTAMCLLLLDEITHLFGRYRPLLNDICKQLHKAIFLEKSELSEFDRSILKRDTQLEQVFSGRYMRQTYFDAYANLMSRLNTFEYKARNIEEQMNKQMKVLEKAISTWQQSYLRKVLFAWRGYVLRQRNLRNKYKAIFSQHVVKVKIVVAWRNWQATVDFLKWKAAAEGAHAAGTTLEGLRNEKIQAWNEVQEVTKRLEERECQLAQAQDELANLKVEKKSLLEKVSVCRVMYRRLAEAADEWISTMMGHVCDREARQEASPVLLQDRGSGVDFLTHWMNEIIAKSAVGPEGKINDFHTEARTCRPYAHLLRALAPAKCTEGWALRLLANNNLLNRAEQLINHCRTALGIPVCVRAQDIFDGSHEHNYLFLVQLFRRFADVTSEDGLMTPLWDKAAIMEYHHRLQAAGAASNCPAYYNVSFLLERGSLPSVEDLRAKWERVYLENQQWSRKAAAVSLEAERHLSDCVRQSGYSRPAMTAKQQKLKKDLCNVPMDCFMDLLVGGRSSVDVPPKTMHLKVVRTLEVHFDTLCKVFRYLSMVGGGSESKYMSVSFATFSQLLVDCKLSDKRYKPNLHGIVARVRSQGDTLMLESPPRDVDPSDFPLERLMAPEFSLALVYTANKRYSSQGNLAEALNKLLVEDIFPNASTAMPSGRESRAQRALNQPLSHLTSIFNHFAEEDVLGKVVPLSRWKELMASANIYTSTFTEAHADDIFERILEQVGGDNDEAPGLPFSFFCDAIAEVAEGSRNQPNESYTVKLHCFLQQQLFPAFSSHLRL